MSDNLVDIVEQLQQRSENVPTKTDIFFFMGVLDKLVTDLEVDSTNPEVIRDTRGLLAAFSIPRKHLMAHIDEANVQMLTNGLKDYVNEMRSFGLENLPPEIAYGIEQMDLDIFHNMNGYLFYNIGKLIRKMRVSEDIEFVEETDLVYLHSMRLNSTHVHGEIQNQLNFFNSKRMMRWSYVNPEAYWLTTDTHKFIYSLTVILEECIHVTQRSADTVKIHTLGFEYKETSKMPDILKSFLGRLMETDVTNILATAFPQMIENKWQWYTDRLADATYEKHHPLRIDHMWMFGWIVAQVSDQLAEYILQTTENLPEYFLRNPQYIEDFFSTEEVIGMLHTYSHLLFTYSTDDLQIRGEIKKAAESSINNGIFDMFLRHTVKLRKDHGENWLVKLNAEKGYGGEILVNILSYLNNNNESYRELLTRYGKNLKPWEARFFFNERLTIEELIENLFEATNT